MSEWMPIETAPKDGTPILGYCARLRTPKLPCDMAVVFWDADGRVATFSTWWGEMPNGIVMMSPTHWMPLPQPPP